MDRNELIEVIERLRDVQHGHTVIDNDSDLPKLAADALEEASTFIITSATERTEDSLDMLAERDEARTIAERNRRAYLQTQIPEDHPEFETEVARGLPWEVKTQ